MGNQRDHAHQAIILEEDLDREAPAPDEKDRTTIELPALGSAPRVLIADDDWDTRHAIRMALEEDGYDVEEARDGIQVMVALRGSARPTILLLDLQMPRLNGVGVLNALSNDTVLMARTAVIIVTATGEGYERIPAHLLKGLVMATIHQPFDLHELAAKVKLAAQRALGW